MTFPPASQRPIFHHVLSVGKHFRALGVHDLDHAEINRRPGHRVVPLESIHAYSRMAMQCHGNATQDKTSVGSEMARRHEPGIASLGKRSHLSESSH